MLSSRTLRQLQSGQYAHDLRNHFDVLALHKAERLKHYGLHFAKYVGRLARGPAERKSVHRTITDAFLINLSAANTLMQDLSVEVFLSPPCDLQDDHFRAFADAAGRFADACEKLDHLEDFSSIAKTANLDITKWLLSSADLQDVDLVRAVAERRKELATRHFYIAD